MSGCARAGYSVWTNSSFKAPLISSAVACILGNALYCIGYDTKWLSILMAARLLTGLGKGPFFVFLTLQVVVYAGSSMHA